MAKKKKNEPENASEANVASKEPPVEVDPPQRVKCPGCGCDRVLVAYTNVYKEMDPPQRRVTGSCTECSRVVYWWEKI